MKNVLFSLAAAVLAFVGTVQAADWSPEGDAKHEIVLGKPDAPVTIIEYASLTCPHCAKFHLIELPEIKKEWIDTGKAKLVYRHFPLDQSALAAAMAVSCLPPDSRVPVMRELFLTVSDWAPEQDIAPVLHRVMGEDVDLDKVISCMGRDGYPQEIMEAAESAVKAAAVDATPTFFVNGEKIVGSKTAAEFGDIIRAKLGSSQ